MEKGSRNILAEKRGIVQYNAQSKKSEEEKRLFMQMQITENALAKKTGKASIVHRHYGPDVPPSRYL